MNQVLDASMVGPYSVPMTTTTYRDMTLAELVDECRRQGIPVPAPSHDDHARMETMIAALEGAA